MKKRIYLDNAATSFPKPPCVGEAMKAFLETGAGNPSRGGHWAARAAEEVVDSARRRLAKFLNAPDPSRIVFTLNATDAIHLALDGLLQPGDHVLTSSMEHNSVMRPLHLWSRRGALLEVIPSISGLMDPRIFERAIRPNTKLIVCAHASNVSGVVMPVKAIAEMARKRGCVLLVDAAQTAGHTRVDAAAMGAGMIALSGHKGLMGPTGTGALYVSEEVDLRPVRTGGTGTRSEDEEQPMEFPQRMESGTPNTAGLAGLDAALKFIEETGLENIIDRQKMALQRIIDGAKDIEGVELVGFAPMPRAGLASFTLEGVDPHEAAAYMDARAGIATRAGLHCAPAAHRTLGTFPDGTLRVSPGYFNTEEDVEVFLAALREAMAAFAR